MKKILLHLESDAKASVFDQITAYDAGVDQVIACGGVTPEEVTNLVYGVMFTRGGDSLRNSAIFVGGTRVAEAERLMERVLQTFFGPFRVSVMFDANGCNTTAVAAVQKMARGRNLAGKKALVLAGTGPVGTRIATLLAREGCQVLLSSRYLSRAQEVCRRLETQAKVKVEPVQVSGGEEAGRALAGVNVLVCCGAPGARLLDEATWTKQDSLEIMADINAVEPLGIEGIKATDDGKERQGKVAYGAIAIGNLKMKIHKAALQALFRSNDQVLDLEAIYALAGEMGE
jgi:hypothetical protein